MSATLDLTQLTEEEFSQLVDATVAKQSAMGLANLPRYKAGFGFCQCQVVPMDDESYFERLDGSHGYFHDVSSCGKLTQSG